MVAFYHLTAIQNNDAVVADDHSKSVSDSDDGGAHPSKTGLNFDICLVVNGSSSLSSTTILDALSTAQAIQTSFL